MARLDCLIREKVTKRGFNNGYMVGNIIGIREGELGEVI